MFFLFAIILNITAYSLEPLPAESSPIKQALHFCKEKISSPNGYGTFGVSTFCEKRFNLPSPYLYKCLSALTKDKTINSSLKSECNYMFESNIAFLTKSSTNLSLWRTPMWGPWYDYELPSQLKAELKKQLKKIKANVTAFEAGVYQGLLAQLEALKAHHSEKLLETLELCKAALSKKDSKALNQLPCQDFQLPSLKMINCLIETRETKKLSLGCGKLIEQEGLGPWYDYPLPQSLTFVPIEIKFRCSGKYIGCQIF